MKGVHSVIHCAAASFVDPKTPSAVVFQGTYDGTVNIIEQSLKAGVKKFIYTSTFMNLFKDMESAFGTGVINENCKCPLAHRTIVKTFQLTFP